MGSKYRLGRNLIQIFTSGTILFLLFIQIIIVTNILIFYFQDILDENQGYMRDEKVILEVYVKADLPKGIL